MATEPKGFIVAKAADLVLGYVLASGRMRQAVIMSVAVSPAFRRAGVGTALMRSGLDYLAAITDEVYLQVDVENEAAIRFYRKLSFKETGRVLSKYYPNGHDALEMSRKVTMR